ASTGSNGGRDASPKGSLACHPTVHSPKEKRSAGEGRAVMARVCRRALPAGAGAETARQGYPRGVLDIEFYVDPSCPWAWVTSRWILEVAPHRDLNVIWKSYCLEIRDDYDVAPTVPADYREAALAGHAISHRMLRVMEAARSRHGEGAVGRLYDEWGARFFARGKSHDDTLLSDCLAAADLEPDLQAAADDEKWDGPIVESMEIAYAFGGPKTQTPTLVVRSDPPHGFKGPVMAPAPTGAAALAMWDALQVLSAQPGFFEITRPRVNPPRPPT